MHLTNKIKDLISSKRILFTTPGHSQGRAILPELENLIGKGAFKIDLSEIDGLDNLQNPEEVILKSQMRASEIYGSKSSYYLINGSSSGILALMLATVRPGDKVLIARNAHKSIINALTLSGATPVWINTEWLDTWNIPGCVEHENIKAVLEKNPDIKSVWLTNPTYEGIVTDISPIAKLCKEKGVFLIIDEAHGSLWNFNHELPSPAIHLGADASVQSLHKTASCFTQGAILHLSITSKIDSDRLQKCLNVVNTTSPSYLILTSIESTIEYLYSNQGRKTLDELLGNIDILKENLTRYFDIFFLQNSKEYQVDKTKLFFGIAGISGEDLSDNLLKKYNIEVELTNNKAVLALTGIGTSHKKLNKLAKAVIKSRNMTRSSESIAEDVSPLITPKVALTPREAFYRRSREIYLKDSVGLISKETIVNYPPGIPLLISGEIIQKKHLEFIKNRETISIIAE